MKSSTNHISNESRKFTVDYEKKFMAFDCANFCCCSMMSITCFAENRITAFISTSLWFVPFSSSSFFCQFLGLHICSLIFVVCHFCQCHWWCDLITCGHSQVPVRKCICSSHWWHCPMWMTRFLRRRPMSFLIFLSLVASIAIIIYVIDVNYACAFPVIEFCKRNRTTVQPNTIANMRSFGIGHFNIYYHDSFVRFYFASFGISSLLVCHPIDLCVTQSLRLTCFSVFHSPVWVHPKSGPSSSGVHYVMIPWHLKQSS